MHDRITAKAALQGVSSKHHLQQMQMAAIRRSSSRLLDDQEYANDHRLHHPQGG